MITDFSLIKVLLNRANYNNYIKFVHEDALADDTRIVLKDLKALYEHTALEEITLEELSTYFHHVRHPEYPLGKHEQFKTFFEKCFEETLNNELIDQVIKHYQKETVYYKLEALCINRAPIKELITVLEEYKTESEESIETLIESNNFKDIFYNVQHSVGLSWPLECLNQSLGPIRKGHFGLIAAYVHRGKTAFMAQLAAFMGMQLTNEQCVLYFNNEGANDEVQMRICQAMLNMSLEDILQDMDKAEKRYKNMLEGNLDKIKVVDANNLTINEIQEMAINLNAGLILIDQLANLPSEENKNSNEAGRLKKLSRNTSSLATRCCPVIAAHQCDITTANKNRFTGEEKGQHYVEMGQLDNSKIHLPGAANFVITIGFDNQFPNTRYIHVPKNRMPGVVGMVKEERFLRKQVSVDWDRMRYKD